MIESDKSPRWQLPLLYVAQAQKELTHNEALILLDSLVHSSAQSLTNSPPLAPQVGQCWLIDSAPTGGWTGRADSLALWSAGGWRFIAPKLGMSLYLEDTRQRYFYQEGDGGSSWKTSQAVASPSGGTTIDSEARTTINNLIVALRMAGLA